MSRSPQLFGHAYHLLILIYILSAPILISATDELRKGLSLMSYVENPCETQARPMNWSTISSLEKWNLRAYNEPWIDSRLERFWGDRKLSFQTVGVSRVLTQTERQLYNVATQSTYVFKMNIAAGVMVVEAAFHYNDSKIPMSQVMAALWQREFDSGGSAAGEPLRNIDTVVRKRVINDGTATILTQTLRDTGGELPVNQSRVLVPFPAATSLAVRNGFYSAVGTPNGKPQAYILFQHRNLWGNRTIESVEILNLGARNAAYYMKFVFAGFDPANRPDRSIPEKFRLETGKQDEDKWWKGCGCAVM